MRSEQSEFMNNFFSGVSKVLLTTFVYACIWTIVDPYGYPNDTPVDYFYLIRYVIHAVAAYFLLKVVFLICRKIYPSILSFSNIYIVLLSLSSLFYLVYVPYGPDLGIFSFLRNL